MAIDSKVTAPVVRAKPAGGDAISLILQQAGKSAEEVAACWQRSTTPTASAEQQFTGEAPTLVSYSETSMQLILRRGALALQQK
ncbi:MAG: hypothetical protein R3C56_34030 [Pirellulaceae bacterium]